MINDAENSTEVQKRKGVNNICIYHISSSSASENLRLVRKQNSYHQYAQCELDKQITVKMFSILLLFILVIF